MPEKSLKILLWQART